MFPGPADNVDTIGRGGGPPGPADDVSRMLPQFRQQMRVRRIWRVKRRDARIRTERIEFAMAELEDKPPTDDIEFGPGRDTRVRRGGLPPASGDVDDPRGG